MPATTTLCVHVQLYSSLLSTMSGAMLAMSYWDFGSVLLSFRGTNL